MGSNRFIIFQYFELKWDYYKFINPKIVLHALYLFFKINHFRFEFYYELKYYISKFRKLDFFKSVKSLYSK
jgi:hypothetical protein